MQPVIQKKNVYCTCLLFSLFGLLPVHANISTGGDFTLLDHNNQEFNLLQLRGEVVLMFFGYTSCPDVCPAELGVIARVLQAFEKQGETVRGLFVSVDPERDSPQKLKEYTSFFSKRLLGLSGSREQIDNVVRQYRAYYKITQNQNNYVQVDHTSNLYIIDKMGKLNTMVPFGMTAGHIIEVIQNLLDMEK